MIAEEVLPMLAFASREQWVTWLEDHHQTSDGVWLKLARKESGIDSVSFAEAIEVALCFGWIDSQADKLDEAYWLLRFTPRRPTTRWTLVTRRKAEALIARGVMRPAGLREVERARAEGRWAGTRDR